ncbi:MAG: hypothetical protein IKB71_11685 [Lentisphaeria bacterium]|nr:hypothetical protein [Lentisphaeria bacterium]
MESLNSYIMRKIKLRKTLMIIFSVCTVMLICGVCNYVMESGSGTENMTFADSGTEISSTKQKINPREMLMDKRDKKIRIYSVCILLAVMAGSFVIDFIFVRCPVCSGHISYSINPSFCHHCGSSFGRKESI